MTEILDLTGIEDEQRRVQVADDMALVYDAHGNRDQHWRWDHLCETFTDDELGEVTKRVAAWLAPGHRIVSDDPLTIEGSLLCRACGLHGWIRDGTWVEA